MFRSIDLYYPGLNFAAREPVDELIAGFFALAGIGVTDGGYRTAQLAILLAGSYLLSASVLPRSSTALRSMFAVTCSAAFLALTFGDIIWMRAHYFPLLVAAIAAYQARPGGLRLAALIGSYSLFTLAAGSLALSGIGIAQLFAAVLSRLHRRDVSSTAEPPHRSGVWGSLNAVCATIFALSAIAAAPQYPMPEYPANARLARFSAFSLYPEPLVGRLEPNSIVFSQYAARLALLVGIFLALSLLVLLAASAGKRTEARRYFAPGRAVVWLWTILTAAELFLPASVSAYAPYPSLARVVPGFRSVLPWVLLPLGFLLLIAVCAPAFGKRAMGIVTAFSVVAAALALACRPVLSMPRHFAEGALAAGRPIAAKRSPSAHVLEVAGAWAAVPRHFGAMTRLVHNRDFVVELSSNVNPSEAARALDIDPHSRWTTGRPQMPGDFLELRFAAPVTIDRMVLSTRGTPHDYPRGIRIEVGDSPEELETVIEYSDWPGPVSWTADGYPYFGPQSDVVIDFPKRQTGRVLRATQISSDRRFNWSVSEIKLYRSEPLARAGQTNL